jgi:ATP:ADP antiporter, AAA family
MAERSSQSLADRLVSPIVQLRQGEAITALMMFAYSFLAMAGYNMIRPVTRGLFIEKLGAENLPWIQFGAGIAIGFIMQGYTRAIRLAPRRWMIPITLSGIVALMVSFYFLFTSFPTNREVAVGFYLFGLIIGILLISQFWTLANDVYDPRQAKRVFGFIGAGSSLGGFTGAMLTSTVVAEIGTNGVLLVSAATLAICTIAVALLIKREPAAGQSDASKTGEEEAGVSGAEALRLLRSSRHLQVIAMVIGFAAFGSAIIEQQLNMAAAEAKGATNVDSVTAFLAQIIAYYSLIGFVVQITLTSRIHRMLGIGFALMILPVVDSATGLLMLMNGALWTAGLARVTDTSLRYTVDKTTREVLFLPLPVDVKYRAKPFIDVTVDRLAKGMGALLLLVLVQDWGLNLRWQQLSYASVTMMVIWGIFALTARREYLKAFRRSIERQDVKATDIRVNAADLSSIETLVTELAHPDPRRVVYAIDLLESLDKRNLVTPLLLWHDSPDVRERALRIAEATGPEGAGRWSAAVQRALTDADGRVRVAAVGALSAVRAEATATVMRPYLSSADPALVIAAAAALASSTNPADVQTAEDTLRRFADDGRDQVAHLRLHVARALGEVVNPSFRVMLVPLMQDPNIDVALAAIQSARTLGAGDFLFVPVLVSLLRNRRLKAAAREVLVSYGDDVVPSLAYFMRDSDEDVWVRRHVPSTLALLPSAASVEALVVALDDPDGFQRFKAITALGQIRRSHPELTIDATHVSKQILGEASRAFNALTLHYNLFAGGGLDKDSLLARTLTEKYERAYNRVFLLLGLVHSEGDIAAVRTTLEIGEGRTKSGAIEYLDNVLKGDVRRRVMLLVEDMPQDERIRRGNVMYRTRLRDVEDTIAQLLHDDQQAVAAAAIHLVEARKMWSLADDIEHILAHRDPRDFYVFEAASWALAAHRMPAERRKELWREPLPAVELADRLRKTPVFSFASVDELFRIAGLGRQVRHESGRTIYERDATPSTVQFLLEGRVSVATASGAVEPIAVPAPIALEEVLEGSRMSATITALEPVIALSLTTDEFLSLLSENVELAEGIFRTLMQNRPAWQAVVHGEISADLQRKVAAGLPQVDRVLLLQASPLLSHATAEQLLGLAAIARQVPLKVGTDPMSGGTASILIVLDGGLRIERKSGQLETADPGDVVGIYETLGGIPFAATVTVTSNGTALKLEHNEIFDLLANHTDLLQGVFSGMLRAETKQREQQAT